MAKRRSTIFPEWTRLSAVTPLALEPRFMFDAAGAATGAEVAQDAAAQAEAQSVVDAEHSGDVASGDVDLDAIISETGALVSSSDPLSDRTDIAVIDTSVEGYEELVAGVTEGTEVILIDAADGGIRELAAALEGRSGIDSLQILSHGATGELRLGGDVLTADNLSDYADDLAAIGAAMDASGDILLYGCRVGEGGEGRALIDGLASLTRADIAASDDLTGSAAQGGDWLLEVATGSIEASAAITAAAQSAYDGLLVAPADENFNAQSFAPSSTMSFPVNGFTFTSDTEVVFVTAASTDSGFNYRLSSDDGAGDRALFVNADGAALEDGFGFKSTDNSNFKLVSFQIQNHQAGASLNVTLSVLSDTVQVGSGSFDLTTSSASSGITYTHDGDDGAVSPPSSGPYGTFTFDSTYQNVDEVRLVFTGGLNAGAFALDNIDISPAVTNAAPTVTGAPSDVTVTEDVASNVDLSAVTFADADGDSLTVTLAASAGTLAASSGGGVTVGGSGTGTLTLAGTAANINTFLDTTSNVKYTSASNANGNDAATLTITPNDGTVNGTAAVVNLDITAVNDDPTATGVPTDVTVTEDVASNVDLSAITLSDVDSGAGSVTFTLVASAGTLTSSSGGGVTVGGSGTGTLTLAGTVSNIDTFLNTASNIQYTGASNVNGNDAATLTLTVNDGGNTGSGGGGNVALGTVNLDITAVNDDPTATGVPTDVTVTEDVASNVDLSAITLSDVDSGAGSVTFTLVASAGTLTASSGGGVTVGGSGTGTLTLAGTVSNIDTFLNTASNIQYTGTSNLSGNDAATLTLTVNDGGNTGSGGGGNVALGTVNLDITAVNDDPTATGVPTDVTVTEDVASNVDLSAITLSDVDSGAGSVTFTLAASAGTLTASSGGGVTVGGSGTGTLTLAGTVSNIDTFLNTASNIQYTGASNANGNDAATLTLTVNDGGNTGSGGGGNVALGTVNLDITAVNDPPTLTATAQNPTFTEGGSAVTLFSSAAISTVETAQTLTGFAITVTNVSGTSADRLVIDGSTIALVNGATGSTSAPYDYAVALSGSTATITFSNGSATSGALQGILNAAQYSITGDDPTGSGATRVVTITSITDSGGGSATASVSVASTVTVSAVNDDPSATGVPTDVTVTEDVASNVDLSAISLSDVDSGTGSVTFTLAASAGTLTASSGGGVTVGGSGTGTLTLTGTVSNIDTFLNSASNVLYTSASNANGNDAATLTLTVNDGGNTGSGGGGNVALGTVNLDITAVNDDPSATGVPTDVTVTEDVASNVDLSAISLSDVDAGGGSVTFTLAASAGTLRASSGGGVTVAGSGTGTLTLTGTLASVDTFLNTASNVQYTGASNVSGNDAATLTLTLNDGGNTGSGGGGNVSLGTVNVDITAVEDAPVVSGTFTGAVTEGDVGDPPVTATGTLAISDADPGDNPQFADVSTTASDNGYGTFALSNGVWVYTLDQSTVQQLELGETLIDTITFTASDGTTQQLSVTISGSADVSSEVAPPPPPPPPVIDAQPEPTPTVVVESSSDTADAGTPISDSIGQTTSSAGNFATGSGLSAAVSGALGDTSTVGSSGTPVLSGLRSLSLGSSVGGGTGVRLVSGSAGGSVGAFGGGFGDPSGGDGGGLGDDFGDVWSGRSASPAESDTATYLTDGERLEISVQVAAAVGASGTAGGAGHDGHAQAEVVAHSLGFTAQLVAARSGGSTLAELALALGRHRPPHTI